jgi:hypothetical protein
VIDPRDAERARAVLGLPLGASPDQLRARHRELVKKWHPDRFANDPAGQEEATTRMRAINAAYQLLSALSEPHIPTSAAGSSASPAPGSRLTREQIDRLVASIGTNSPVDVFLDTVPYGRQRSYSLAEKMPVVVAYVAWLGSLVGMAGFERKPLTWTQVVVPLAVGAVAYVVADRNRAWWTRFEAEPGRPYWTMRRIGVALAAALLVNLVLWFVSARPVR